MSKGKPSTLEREPSMVDLNDEIEPKHPALGLTRWKWTRVCFMNALTESYFANKIDPPLKLRSVHFDSDSYSGKMQTRARIVCETDKGDSVIITLDPNATERLPPGWAETFTQEKLMRPYCESMDFWGSVQFIQFGRFPHFGAFNLGDAIQHASCYRNNASKTNDPRMTETLDVLLTILVELNWIATADYDWTLGFCFPRFWVAHAAKFNVCTYSLMLDKTAAPRMAFNVTWQDPAFFATVLCLMREFELDTLAMQRVRLDAKPTAAGSVVLVGTDFHGIFKNVDDVTFTFDANTWPFFEAVLRKNFPRLSKLRTLFVGRYACVDIAQFVASHRNVVASASRPVRPGPDLNNSTFDAFVVNYAVNFKAMRAFVEADAHAMRSQKLPIVQSFFRAPTFEPCVVHLIDRALHGRDVLEIGSVAGRLSWRDL